jgi:hypothetical protein
VPEQLVALVGGPGSGKTSFLLMAVRQILAGAAVRGVDVKGEIDVDEQKTPFEEEWRKLSSGLVATKTAEVANAFLMYAKVGRKKRQLYLYDAAGEEFSSVSRMSEQQYFPLVKGFVLFVDPTAFPSVAEQLANPPKARASLQDVVTTTIEWATAGIGAGRNGRIPLNVAVAISKADLGPVKDKIGDIREGSVRSEKCREAIIDWGGRNSVLALEHKFDDIEYFACSPLGRDAESAKKTPFEGAGILEPLLWVLGGGR